MMIFSGLTDPLRKRPGSQAAWEARTSEQVATLASCSNSDRAASQQCLLGRDIKGINQTQLEVKALSGKTVRYPELIEIAIFDISRPNIVTFDTICWVRVQYLNN